MTEIIDRKILLYPRRYRLHSLMVALLLVSFPTNSSNAATSNSSIAQATEPIHTLGVPLVDPSTGVQVNVDSSGANIPGDAANESSLAVSYSDATYMIIGFRQFDTVEDDFRQAGYTYSLDNGNSWNFPGSLDPGVFHSDPVLASSGNGSIYYFALADLLMKSDDGGLTWQDGLNGVTGDKPWMAIDNTPGFGAGHIYLIWNLDGFSRSVDGGITFITQHFDSIDAFGTIVVGRSGRAYVCDNCGDISITSNASHSSITPSFVKSGDAIDGGCTVSYAGPNPMGLLGQGWIAVNDRGTEVEDVYFLGSITFYDPPSDDPLDVIFARSTDGGYSWSQPVRVNDDPADNLAWQWFGTMSVAPNGRIDATWLDTRNDPTVTWSELYYSYSLDGGVTWSPNVPLSPPFNHFLGYPGGNNKLGDYFQTVSDNTGVNIAYAATFNGEQDIWFLRMDSFDCNANLTDDQIDLAVKTSSDCNTNDIPDECEIDCNGNGVPDECDLNSRISFDANTNGLPDECDPVIHVDRNAPGNQSGSSWTNAYTDLHVAIAAAQAVKTQHPMIWVKEGVYTPAPPGGDRAISFALHNGVTLLGGFAGNETSAAQRDPIAHPTILCGDLNHNDAPGFGNRTDNAYHVVAASATGPAAILDGFTVSGGYADGANPHSLGGGLYGNAAGPTIRQCIFTGNYASSGGAVYIDGVSDLHAQRCIFALNASTKGAALYVTDDSLADLSDCLIHANSASTGGGLFVRKNSKATLNNCTVTFNSATGTCGGLFNATSDSALSITSCILWSNVDFDGMDQGAQLTGGMITLDYSCVQGLTGSLGGTGNLGSDPLFADSDGPDDVLATLDDDLRLIPSSPCIDAGDPDYIFDVQHPDLDSHARLLCAGVDMGAYESGLFDYTCDGLIDLSDLPGLTQCLTGPFAPNPSPDPASLPPACLCFDPALDADVDLRDVAAFFNTFAP